MSRWSPRPQRPQKSTGKTILRIIGIICLLGAVGWALLALSSPMAMLNLTPAREVTPSQATSLRGQFAAEAWMWGAFPQDSKGTLSLLLDSVDSRKDIGAVSVGDVVPISISYTAPDKATIARTWAYSEENDAYYTWYWVGMFMTRPGVNCPWQQCTGSQAMPGANQLVGSYATMLFCPASKVRNGTTLSPSNPTILNVHTYLNGKEVCVYEGVTVTSGSTLYTASAPEEGIDISGLLRYASSATVNLKASYSQDGHQYAGETTVTLNGPAEITAVIQLSEVKATTSYPHATTASTAGATTTGTETTTTTTTTTTRTTTTATGTFPTMPTTTATAIVQTTGGGDDLQDCSWGDCYKREGNQKNLLGAMILAGIGAIIIGVTLPRKP